MNKKVITVLIILFAAWLFIVLWVFKKDKKEDTNSSIKSTLNNVVVSNNKGNKLKKVRAVTNEVLFLKSKKVSPGYLDNVVIFWSGDADLVKFYNELESNLYSNLQNDISIDKIEDLKKWKLRKFKIKVTDLDWHPISGVKIYLWWYRLWETDKDWRLVVEKKIDRVYDYMYFQAFKEGYMPGSKIKNQLYNDGRLVVVNFKLKKWNIYNIKTPNKIMINWKKVKVSIKWNCVLKDKLGECYNSAAKVVITYINPSERSLISNPTKALRNGKVVHLVSNWMAFLTFYDRKWDLLKINPDGIKTTEICYKVGKNKIAQRNKMRRTLVWKESDWYWWYDWSLGIWKNDKNAKINVDKDRGLFCFSTKHIY